MVHIQVDFNDRDDRGYIPALVELAHEDVIPGEMIVARDSEGNRAKAQIVDIDSQRGLLYLAMDRDSFTPAKHILH